MVSRAQILVLFSIVAAIAATVVVFQAGGTMPRNWLPVVDSPISRLVWVSRWLLVPGACLMAAVAIVAARRFFTRAAIEGGAGALGSTLDVDIRVVANTLEQVVITVIAYLGLAVTASMEELGIIPAAAIAFAIGRLAFWIGYHIHPLARSFGFALTFLPTFVIYHWLGWALIIPH
jgi:hypothetical protein